nr:juvenile hormone epoxide hydrolase [Prodiamesa olivacea]
MGALQNIIFGTITIAIAFSYQAYRDITKPVPKPELDLNEYWGKGDGKNYKADKTIKPFKISYSDEAIKRLTDKLNDAQAFTDPLEDTTFEYGFNTKHLQKILNYWKLEYLQKWNEREQFLNQFPQFTTQIQGLNIHYIHVKPKTTANTKVYPLILLHGWPGSVREFYDIIPMLTKPSKDNIAFEVIVPSLVGYGFSDGAAKKGFGAVQQAIILRNLMLRVGFEKFYVQGGDWGSLVGSNMASLFPENVRGYHSNMCGVNTALGAIKTTIASFYPSMFIEEKYISWMYPFGPKFMFMMQESGYMHIQATKPDTIGIALTSNPVGLLAYIVEKFSTWTNPDYRNLADGGLEKYFTMDSLLDNVMIYYISNSITTSMRMYKESFSAREFELEMDRVVVEAPTGCARFKFELMHQPEFILKQRFKNIVQISYHEDGGHFAAMQLPKILYNDFIEYIKKTL